MLETGSSVFHKLTLELKDENKNYGNWTMYKNTKCFIFL